MKVALITGGTGGIGAALVERFFAAGYSVAFTYNKNAKRAGELAEKYSALAIAVDVTSEGEIISAVNRVISELGRIDVLVNNAGISAFSLFTDITLDGWNNMLATNLTGAFLFSREVARGMISHKSGRIINVSSIWGLVGASCEVAYSTAKAGLIGMTRALAKELGPSGITVNAIAPGVIDTPMNSALGEDALAALADETPLMRIGQPVEVADAAVFLASEGGAFITGEVLNISGGFVI